MKNKRKKYNLNLEKQDQIRPLKAIKPHKILYFMDTEYTTIKGGDKTKKNLTLGSVIKTERLKNGKNKDDRTFFFYTKDEFYKYRK